MLDKKKVTKENILKILEFLPYFESEDHVFFQIDNQNLMDPYVYDGKVLDFIKTLYDENIIYSFDWVKWQPEAIEYYDSLDLLKNADLDTLRKLLTVHIRKERFCSGHLAQVIKTGHLLNILKRLNEIKFQLFSK